MAAASDSARNPPPATEPLDQRPNDGDRQFFDPAALTGWRSTQVLQALPAAIYMTDANGLITFYNGAAAELWGVRPEIGQGEWCGSWRLYWPDGKPMPHDECPMAVALKEGRALRGVEAVAERPDGTRVPFLAYPTPLHDESGVVIGAVNMLVDIAEHRQAERGSQLLAAIVESSDDAIASKSLEGIITSWNRGAERLFGYSASEAVGQPVVILIPLDRRDEEIEILERIRRGERIENYETVRQRRDGSRVEVSLTISPVRNARSEIVGASKIARDITERRRAEEQRRLVLREMGHRAKNLFALAGGIVGQSAHWAESTEEFADAVKQRLAALAQAHDLTLPRYASGGGAPSQPVRLEALVRAMLAPYDGAPDGGGRTELVGPDLMIGAGASTSFALLLHEFATNAAKHGALSTPDGRVCLTWLLEEEELQLTWREEGGPPIDAPPRYEGFGSALTANTVSSQFGGQVQREWRREGLVIRLCIPFKRLSD